MMNTPNPRSMRRMPRCRSSSDPHEQSLEVPEDDERLLE